MSNNGWPSQPTYKKKSYQQKPNKQAQKDPPMSAEDRALVMQWLGSKRTPDQVFQRPSAEAWPNTFIFMWKEEVLLGKYNVAYIALDVQYEGNTVEGGKALKALGGMWVKSNPRLTGDLEPQQDTEVGDLVRGQIQKISPDPAGQAKLGKW